MLRIAVLISGGGTNLQAIIDGCENGQIDGQVVGVIANKEKAYGLERASRHKIPGVYIGRRNYPDIQMRSQALVDQLKALQPDLIVLAGFLEILQPNFIASFRDKIINIHPSLIPKYAGKGYYGMKVHEAVIQNQEAFSGATVHFVDDGVDTGQIIMQSVLRVGQEETAESLQKRVLKIEHEILVSSIQKFCNREL